MTTEEIIEDLKNQMQELENIKTQISEAQLDIRNTICALQMEAQIEQD